MERNIIYNCDCLEGIKAIPDNSIDMCFTSPPYNRERNDAYEYYDDTLKDYLGLLTSVTDEMIRVSTGDVIVNVQMNLYNKADVCKYIGEYSEKMKGIVIWEKNNPTPSANFNGDMYSITNAYEFFLVLSGGGYYGI